MHSQASDIRNAPMALWRIAATFLNVLHALFGAPEDVARQHTLTRKAYVLLNSWLRAGEAMLRRLLLIEAAALQSAAHTHTMEERHSAESASPPARARRAVYFTADDPQSWRVSFRCFLNRRCPRRRDAGGPGRDVRFRSAWPLAERYEAMLRVFNAPHSFAKRLARRLNKQPHRAVDLLRAPPEYQHRVDCAATFDEHAEHARRSWDSS